MKIGDRVRVIGGGVDDKREGVIVSSKLIPTDNRGIPKLGQGHYKPMSKDEVAIRDDNGNWFTMFRNYLQRI